MSIKVKKPITQEHFKQTKLARVHFLEMETEVINRLDYILHKVAQLFDDDLDTWYFNDAEEGEVGNLWPNIDSESIGGYTLECEGKMCNNDIGVILIRGGVEWDLGESIPLYWLYEDFEEELIFGKAQYELLLEKRRIEEEKQKLAKKKKQEENKLLAEQAAKKLTKEELAALKKSL